MPKLQRPDGVEIHWEEAGEGPLVVLASSFINYPGIFASLADDLARDHRVVEYDLRGNGRSSRAGPYELDVDAEDLSALVQSLGPPATVLGFGDGAMRAVKGASARTDLYLAVVVAGGNPVGRDRVREADSGLFTSDEVVEGMFRMVSVDYRSALRSIITSVSPQATEDEIRERVERTLRYCPLESAQGRGGAWIDGDATDEARRLGGRLWILESGTNPWFGSSWTLDHTPLLLPEAHILSTPDGPISRPDIPAGVVRELTAQLRGVNREAAKRRH